MEVLCLEIEREHVGQQGCERNRDIGPVYAMRREVFAVAGRVACAMRCHGECSIGACLESGLTHPLATLIVVKMCKRRLRSYLRALKSPGRTLSRSTPASRAYGRATRTLGTTSTCRLGRHLALIPSGQLTCKTSTRTNGERAPVHIRRSNVKGTGVRCRV